MIIFLLSLLLIGAFFGCLYVLSILSRATYEKNKKTVMKKAYGSELFDKIDKLTEGTGGYKPDKIIVGNYYWKMIPSHMTWESEMGVINGRAVITKFGEADSIMYSGIEIVHDEENEYTFDLK